MEGKSLHQSFLHNMMMSARISMINAMMYQPPCDDDIKEWARLGATGWKWEGDLKKWSICILHSLNSIDILCRYLARAEKYTPNPQKPNAYASNHGTSGPWQITHTDTGFVHLSPQHTSIY